MSLAVARGVDDSVIRRIVILLFNNAYLKSNQTQILNIGNPAMKK